MAEDVWSIATRLAILSQARRGMWESPADFTGPPDSAGAGVDLADAVRTWVAVNMRENVHTRTSRVTITTLDLTATYSITINDGGGAVSASYDAAAGAAADEEDVILGLRDAINGAAGIGVTAVAEDSDAGGTYDTIRITGDAEADYAITAFSATGTGVMAVEADPVSASMRLFWTARARVGSTAPSGWRGSHTAEVIDYRGFMPEEPYFSGGKGRLFVQLSSITGHASDAAAVTINNPTVHVGPCLSEDGQ